MSSKTKTIIGILVFTLFLGLAYFSYHRLKDRKAPPNITQAPEKSNTEAPSDETGNTDNQDEKVEAFDFIVYDENGESVHLSDFFGQPIIINFWASWCGYCVKEMPDFEEKYQQYGEKIHFLMVDCVDGQRETQAIGEKFIAENGFTFPVYYDTDGNAVETYQAYSLPTSVFIDKDGNIIAYQPGMLTSEILQKGIDLIYEQ